MALELSELPLHYSSISIILKLASLSGRARIQRSCLAPMRPAGSGAGGCVEADHVQRLVLLARADGSTKA